MIDDSALLYHRSEYDPAKAREYYLRTRKLKGRRRGRQDPSPAGDRPQGSVRPAGGGKASARREAMREQVAALEKRLDRLKEELAKLVEAAKIRSGVDPAEAKAEKKTKEDKPERDRKDRKLSAKEKREAAKRSKEYREENKEPGAAKQVEELQEQIRETRQKIQDALEAARKKSEQKSRSKTASKGR